MSFEFVHVDHSNQNDWANVIRSVYGRASEREDFPIEPREQKFLVTKNGQPVSACSVYGYDVVRGDTVLKCAGIAAVGTVPSARNSGAGHFLMSSVIRQVAGDGFDISALYPYRETYYRRFGYETCGWRYQIKCPQGRVPQVKSSLPVRQLGMDELGQLNVTYETFIRARSGSPLRNSEDWLHRMGKRKPYVFAIGDPVEAYLWATHDDFWGDVQIGEMAWKSDEGYRGCLSLIKSLVSNMSSATWAEPPDSPMLDVYLDQGIEVSISRPTMSRILNLQSLVTKLKSDSSYEFSMQTKDSIIESNNGTWNLNVGSQTSTIEASSSSDFSIEIGHLSQAIMGQPSLAKLGSLGKVEITNSSAFQNACKALPAFPVVMMEFF